MLFFMLFGIKGFVKVLSAPQNLLMPIILCMCCVGAFGCSNRMFGCVVPAVLRPDRSL